MSALERVTQMLADCGSGSAHMPPTTLYNEGWMLRLILDWCSAHPTAIESFTFLPGSRWYSEALLSSRFAGRGNRSEGFTHADAVIGHFHFRPGGRGDIGLAPNAKQLSIVEAKMGSMLSPGISNAPGYNQAARNVACLVHLLSEAPENSSTLERLSFTVIAPQQRIDEGAFGQHLAVESILKVVESRVGMFAGQHDEWFETHFRSLLNRCQIVPVSWENTITAISQYDEHAGRYLTEFLTACLRHNPMSAYRERRVNAVD